jgi:hypothetical protein
MESFTKNPTEDYPIGFDFRRKLPDGTLIAGIIGSAFRLTDWFAARLTSAYTAGANTLLLDVNVRAGAVLILDRDTDTEEIVYVQAVTGSGPYAATLFKPMVYDHAANSVVAYQPGATADVLKPEQSAIGASGQEVQVWVKGGIAGQKYEVSVFVTLNNGATLRDAVLMRVESPL